MPVAEDYTLPLEDVKIGLVRRLMDDSIIQTGDTLLELRLARAPLARRVWQVSWTWAKVPTIELAYEVFGTHTSFLLLPQVEDDFRETNQLLRNTVTNLRSGDGVAKTFQLEITRALASKSGSKKVMHPVNPLTELRVGGTAMVEGTDYIVDYANGIVTLATAPGAGVLVDADFDYKTAVRWLSEQVDTTVTQAYANPQQVEARADLIEVFDE